ncbi:hypothetical protein TW81_15305 [Vibrio galatheae]|uniref:LamG-like jellyroll fold domain-containing protein n=2 Tax=Vibrio galatheae TaxID=579748 RepID=A0A0F4NG10_9VIBR|nr:hypothetical protein TW81_15305 [Vibrio galatheae]
MLGCIVLPSFAATNYVLSPGMDLSDLPSCSTNNWDINPFTNVYHCRNGKVELDTRDSIEASSNSVLKADDGFSFDGKNTIGSPSARIDLESSWGSIDWSENANKLYGGITANSSDISLEDVEVTGGVVTGGDIDIKDSSIGGEVSSSNNKVTIKDSDVGGNINASGDIVIEGVEVAGSITTPNNQITIKDSDVAGDIYANGDIVIEESEVTGNITTPNNKITIKESDVVGNISANGDVVIEDSNIRGNIISTNNKVELKDGTQVIGDVTAGQPNWGTVYVKDGSSVVGTCLYRTEPENACNSADLPEPVALYHLEESWTGANGEVKDSSGNGLHGRAYNGASTEPASSNSALPAIDMMGTCGYGSFVNSQDQYVEITDNSLLDMDGSFTVSAWIYPKSLPDSDLFSIVSKDSNFEFHLNSDGKIFWWWLDEDGDEHSITSNKSVSLDQWSFITIRYDEDKERAELYIDAKKRGNRKSEQPEINSKPLQIGHEGYPGRAFDGFIDEVQIFDIALSKQQIQVLMEQRHECSSSPELQCFTDDFNNGSLSDLWVTSTSKGSFTPGIVNNRLRFTEAVRNQATASSYQRLFPARDNLVEVEFDHFAYGGNGADGIAIVLSDATVTPSAGAFGGPLGYGFKRNEPGFSGGWLGVGIDEYGNFSNEGGTGSEPGRRRQSVALRGSGVGETGYKYLAGACNNGNSNQSGNCLDPKVDDNNTSDPSQVHRYKIVVDSRNTGQSNVEIFRRIGAGSNWQTIVGPIDVLASQYAQSPIPEDFLLSITGSTGGSRNNHEIDNFQVCALNSRPIEDQIDHFRFSHTGSGLTCNAEEVTIQACKNSTCSELYTGSVTATLTPSSVSGGGGWVGGNEVTFSGGSAKFDLRKNQPGTVTIGVSGSSPTTKPFSTTLCSSGGSAFASDKCAISFQESGFVVDVADMYANSAATAVIKAVKASDSSQQCVPSFGNVTKKVGFWSTYISPDIDNVIEQAKISIDSQEIATEEGSLSSIDIQFDNNGEAVLNLNYPEAGQMQLNAKYSGQGDESGLTLVGSDQFVSVPKALGVVAKNSSGADGSCSDANISCNVFTKAGQEFSQQVIAYAEPESDGTAVVTKNYTNGVTLEHEIIAPSTADGGVVGVLGTSSATITLGEMTTINQSVSEVGVFDFKVKPNTYLGSSLDTPDGVASNVGRFVPAYFNVQPSAQAPMLRSVCQVGTEWFTYIGQSFSYLVNPSLVLNPVVVDGSSVTSNYFIGQWWRYSGNWAGRSYASSNGLGIEFNPDNLASLQRADTSGSQLELVDEKVTYVKQVTPIEPFDASFDLTVSKADLTDLDNVCFKTADSNSANDCLSHTFSDVDGNMQLRWGQMLIHNTYGAEVSPVRQRVEVQHFANNRFQTNTADSCTDFVAVGRFSFTSSDYNVVINGSPTQPEVNASLMNSTIDKGEGWIEFSAPGANATGEISTSFNLETHGIPWLKRDISGNSAFDEQESGVVQFGIYRGNDRVIWWSEKN